MLFYLYPPRPPDIGKQLLVDLGDGLPVVALGGITIGIKLIQGILRMRSPSAAPGKPAAGATFYPGAIDGEI